MKFKTVRKEEVSELEPFLKACYDESGLFDRSEGEYDRHSVISAIKEYLDDDRFLVRKLVSNDTLAGMFIITFANNFLNLKHRICVEFFVRPNPILCKVTKCRAMLKMIAEIENCAKKACCNRIQMQLENNNDVYKHLEKKGYRRNEIIMIKEVK